ncbi:DNA-methyltransferase [Paenibacillus chitinolyticus]|uniref:DNA-methyltransferase n=1 Tax=Paenibacillus chitinolyticus TaxID=79263 RepID=UPI0036711016
MNKDLLEPIELNRIYQMDCLEGMKLIPDKSVDMILCDLPYGTTQNNWDVVIPLDKLWLQYERIIKDNGAIVLTAQTPFDKKLGASNLKLLKYEWIWEKNKATGHLNSKKMPMKAHENILVFYKGLPTYNPQGLVKKEKPTIRKGGAGNGTNYGRSDRDAIQEYTNFPRDILRFDTDAKTPHPTVKPIELFEYLIKTYTNANEIVLDNCMGSGTTAVAAKKLKRNFIGFETKRKYIELANIRIEGIYNKENDAKIIDKILNS